MILASVTVVSNPHPRFALPRAQTPAPCRLPFRLFLANVLEVYILKYTVYILNKIVAEQALSPALFSIVFASPN